VGRLVEREANTGKVRCKSNTRTLLDCKADRRLEAEKSHKEATTRVFTPIGIDNPHLDAAPNVLRDTVLKSGVKLL
jgi:hypothetical protein